MEAAAGPCLPTTVCKCESPAQHQNRYRRLSITTGTSPLITAASGEQAVWQQQRMQYCPHTPRKVSPGQLRTGATARYSSHPQRGCRHNEVRWAAINLVQTDQQHVEFVDDCIVHRRAGDMPTHQLFVLILVTRSSTAACNTDAFRDL